MVSRKKALTAATVVSVTCVLMLSGCSPKAGGMGAASTATGEIEPEISSGDVLTEAKLAGSRIFSLTEPSSDALGGVFGGSVDVTDRGCFSLNDGTLNSVIVSARPVAIDSESSFTFEGGEFKIGDKVEAGGGGFSEDLFPEELAQIAEVCGEFQSVMRLSSLKHVS